MANASTDDGWPTHCVTRDGRRFARIAYGDEPDDWGADRHPCRDCGVVKGEYHVRGMCDVERCPSCGRQFASCDCDFVGDEGREDDYGTTDDYHRAFEVVRGKGISDNHLALLRAHYAAPDHTATWVELAAAVGAACGTTVNRRYGRLAERVGRQLGVDYPPHEHWPYILVMWAAGRDPHGGRAARTRTPYVLRRPAIEALQRLGLLPRARRAVKARRTKRRR